MGKNSLSLVTACNYVKYTRATSIRATPPCRPRRYPPPPRWHPLRASSRAPFDHATRRRCASRNATHRNGTRHDAACCDAVPCAAVLNVSFPRAPFPRAAAVTRAAVDRASFPRDAARR